MTLSPLRRFLSAPSLLLLMTLTIANLPLTHSFPLTRQTAAPSSSRFVRVWKPAGAQWTARASLVGVFNKEKHQGEETEGKPILPQVFGCGLALTILLSCGNSLPPTVARAIPEDPSAPTFVSSTSISTRHQSFPTSVHLLSLADDDDDTAVVNNVISALQQSAGDREKTFSVYERIGDIITEGKGIGGAINYKGVQLERGYVADEDTSIYNPGLTLLTESEKGRLVDAVVESRKIGIEKNQWGESNQLAYDFLREKLDPLHMKELKGYLGIVPVYSAVVYLAVLGVQQFARGLFPVAYIVGALAIFLPAIVLIALGPQ